MAKSREGKGAGPGGREPDSRRPGSLKPGPARGGRGKHYTPAERLDLLQAYIRSGVTAEAFSVATGVSVRTLRKWRHAYETHGPRGLEFGKAGRPPGSGTGSKQPPAVKEAVLETRRRFPYFGMRRIRDYLARFLHLRVSAGGVGGVLKEAAVPPAAPAPRRKRRSEEPRRFERSRPGELWQSDITSYLLRRHHRRVYLTVFLDDCSRFIVSWSLRPHQRQELVTECLLDGIQRFGKPREVLTDQGRQYFAWRGKSAFQKLLEKEGIRHVVARTHHPQTLGKCERLWRTVGEELIDRAHPEDLEEARERLGHFVTHYNHARPHSSLEGLTPADRFFGAEAALREELKAAMDDNELRLALGERPRRRVFLVGQVGDRAVSVHGEKGRLVIQTPDGVREEIGMEVLGNPGRKELGDGEQRGDSEEAAEVREAGALCVAPAGDGGAGAVGAGRGGGEEAGARDGDRGPALLAGEDGQEGGGGGAEGDGASPLAVEPDGGERDGGGAAEAAAREAWPGGLGGDAAAPTREGSGEGAGRDAGAGADPRPDAGAPGSEVRRCEPPGTQGTGSGCGCGSTGGACGESDGCSPGATA